MKKENLIFVLFILIVVFMTVFLAGCSHPSKRLCQKKCVMSGGKVYSCPDRCEAVDQDWRRLGK